MKTLAQFVVDAAYKGHSVDIRNADKQVREIGGRRIHSSNWDAGSSGWSFCPTETWSLPDGSVVEIGYQHVEAIK